MTNWKFIVTVLRVVAWSLGTRGCPSTCAVRQINSGHGQLIPLRHHQYRKGHLSNHIIPSDSHNIIHLMTHNKQVLESKDDSLDLNSGKHEKEPICQTNSSRYTKSKRISLQRQKSKLKVLESVCKPTLFFGWWIQLPIFVRSRIWWILLARIDLKRRQLSENW